MNNVRILVVEDSLDLCEELVDHLQFYGYQASAANSIGGMRQALRASPADILLLDLGLPDGDALTTLEWLREAFGLRLGIIVLTARGHVDDRIRALSEGVDSYLVKPVNLRELRATISQLVQRLPEEHPPEWLANHSWQLNTIDAQLVTPAGQGIALTAAESQLLDSLFSAQGEIVSRETLCARIYINQQVPSTRRLDTLVSRLRNKVRRETGQVPPLVSYRNAGYVFRRSDP